MWKSSFLSLLNAEITGVSPHVHLDPLSLSLSFHLKESNPARLFQRLVGVALCCQVLGIYYSLLIAGSFVSFAVFGHRPLLLGVLWGAINRGRDRNIAQASISLSELGYLLQRNLKTIVEKRFLTGGLQQVVVLSVQGTTTT